MATISRSNIGKQHDKISVKLDKTDYLPSFEKALKEELNKFLTVSAPQDVDWGAQDIPF